MNITLNYKGNKSFVVSGLTKEHKEQLMALGGKYNPHLTMGPGFIFFNKRENEEQEVTDFVNNQNGGSGTDVLLIKTPTQENSQLTNKTTKYLSTNKTIKSPLPSTKSSINYPNRFTASNELLYQIIIETCPLPYIDQKITVKYIDNDLDCIVANINDGSPVNDITLTYQEDNVDKQTRAVIINGKWQIYLLEAVHELIFH